MRYLFRLRRLLGAATFAALLALGAPHCNAENLPEFGRDLFDRAERAAGDPTSVRLSPGTAYIFGLSPNRGNAADAEAVVLTAINEARQTLIVAIYSLSNKNIAKALVAAKQRGVDVRVVADKKQNSTAYTAVTFLANEGIPVVLNDQYASMHHKMLVIDGVGVSMGSYNYTSSATSRNAEDVLYIRNARDIADAMTKEWLMLWSEGERVQPRH